MRWAGYVTCTAETKKFIKFWSDLKGRIIWKI